MNGTSLQTQNHIKDLEILFQNDLNFDEHRKQTEKKAYQKLGMIIRYSRSIRDIDSKKILFFLAYVRSILEYGSIIWNPETKKSQDEIERVQKTFLRYLFKKENGVYSHHIHISHKILLELIDLKSLSER